MKTLSEINCFSWSKTIETYRKTNTFLILGHSKNNEKTMPKGISKVMFFDAKLRHGPSRFDLSFDFRWFSAMPKNHHFWTPSQWTKKSKKTTLGAPKGRTKSARRIAGGVIFWLGGSEGPPQEKNDRGAEEQLVRDLTRHGPMARRMYTHNARTVQS